MSEKSTAYFTNEALARMVSAQGKIVERIIIVLWQNAIDSNNSVEIIDALQLRFAGDEKLTIGCNENSDGLDIVDYQFKDTKKQLEEEFDGKIKLHALDASTTKMWQDIQGKTLKGIRLTKEDENYRADSLVLDFGDEGRTVGISPYDGLVIDYFEEV
jgi:hypothetical protein